MSCLTNGCPPPRTGTRRCHCAGCHETFSGLTAFDRHQTLNGGSHCHNPATRGLIQRDDGVWRLPGERPEALISPMGDGENGLTGVPATPEPGDAFRDAQEAAL